MKLYYCFLLSLVVFTLSCQENDVINEDAVLNGAPKVQGINKLDLINCYLMQKRLYSLETRTQMQRYESTAIEINGDTLALLYNYEEGWELFSYEEKTPMVLLRSRVGHLDFSTLENDVILGDFIMNLCTCIQRIKASKVEAPVDPSWIMRPPLEPAPDSISNKVVAISLQAPLLKTEWTQDPYWGRYVPKIDASYTQLGCCAVALGSFLRYTDAQEELHLPIVPLCADTCENIQDGYIFSNFVSDAWDRLANTLGDENEKIRQTAKFLGYLAKSINSEFGIVETKSSLTECQRFLNDLKVDNEPVFNMVYEPYNSDTILSILKKQKVVFVRATSDSLTNTVGHAFLFDGFHKEDLCEYDSKTHELKSTTPLRLEFHVQWGVLTNDTITDIWCDSRIESVWRLAGVSYGNNKRILYDSF